MKRWTSVTAAGFGDFPKGRALRTSPASTEAVSRA